MSLTLVKSQADLHSKGNEFHTLAAIYLKLFIPYFVEFTRSISKIFSYLKEYLKSFRV